MSLIKHHLLTAGYHFKIIQNDLEADALWETYQLRYEIYCLERHFLSEKVFQTEKESDQYDDCSIHFASYTQKENRLVGTVRLVQPKAEQRYPFEEYCSVFPKLSPPPREQTAEVSRLVIKKDYRYNQKHDKRLILGLYKQMYGYSQQNGIRYWYAAMEDSLSHSLEKIGVKLNVIGPSADYYGTVTPYLIDLEETMAYLKQKNPFLNAWFKSESIPMWLWIKGLLVPLVKNRLRQKHSP